MIHADKYILYNLQAVLTIQGNTIGKLEKPFLV